MGGALKKILSSLLGVVIALAWWSIRGNHSHHEAVVNSIPAKVWDGGGTITIDVDTTVAGKLSMEFNERRKNGRSLTTFEQIGSGTHSWSVEVPRNAGGYIEFGADAPQPGARMSWTIRHGGRRIASESDTLDKPLQPNEAFFLQRYYKDYSRPGASEDDGESDSSDD